MGMLKIPAPRLRPHQHILSPHRKYVVVWAIILLAVVSSYIPFPPTLHARSNYRDTIIVKDSKRVKPVTISNERLRREKSIAIRKERSTRILNNNYQPTITPTPTPTTRKKIVSVNNNKILENISSTPTPTAQVHAISTGNAEQDLLSTLNNYRQKNGKNALSWDSTLASFAKERANKFDAEGKMDSHQGFQDMLSSDGFARMGFNALAENSSYGDTRDPVYIIETLYGQSSGHNANQLSNEYTHVGIGASGKATDFVFGGRKR